MKKRKDGRLEKKIVLPNGRTKTIYGKSEIEIAEKVYQLRKEHDAGLELDDSTKVHDWCKTWYDTLIKDKYAESTRANYSNAVNNYIIPSIGAMKLKAVKPVHIQQILNGMAGKSDNLQAKVKNTTKRIMDYAVQNGLIVRNPADGLTTNGNKSEGRKPITEEQETELLNELVKLSNIKLETFINLALYCGLRKGEILGLTWKDIDFDKKLIKITKAARYGKNQVLKEKNTKSKAGVRFVPIPDEQYELLKTNKSDGFVITGTKGQQCTKMVFRRLWEKLKLSYELTPHILRHTYCTNLFYAGVPLQTASYLMGHTSIRVTAEIYTFLDESDALKIADTINSHYKMKHDKTDKTDKS